MQEFIYDLDVDGVATITWDVPGKSMNVLSLEGFAQLEAHIETALADEAVKGVIITSGKPDFAAGMDLNILATGKGVVDADPAKQVFDAIMGMHAILRKIERAGMDPKTLKRGKAHCRGAARHGAGHRVGTALGLPPHFRGGQSARQDRLARDQGRYLPRCRRHDAAGAQAGRDGRGPLPVGRQADGPKTRQICGPD